MEEPETIVTIDWEARAKRAEEAKLDLEIDKKDLEEKCKALEETNKELTKRLSDAARLARSYTYSISTTRKDKKGKIVNDVKKVKMELVDTELSNLMELLDGTRYE